MVGWVNHYVLKNFHPVWGRCIGWVCVGWVSKMGGLVGWVLVGVCMWVEWVGCVS
jgi:hypothetical protein